MSYTPQNQSLNSEQLSAAIVSPYTPLRIIAGAGTGKTTTLVERVHYLLSLGISPSDILPITFTTKSREALAERLPDSVTPRTFHSFAASLLNKSEHKDRSWLSDSQRRQAVKDCCYGPDESPSRQDLDHFITDLSSFFQTASFEELQRSPDTETLSEALSPSTEPDYQRSNFVHRVARYYRQRLSSNTFCFDTLQFRAAELLRSADHQYPLPRHLLVDEFQDTNPVQYSMVRSIAPEDLTVVGDAKQCIYRWRGSDPSLFETLSVDYPDLQTLALTTNYRSSPQIINVVNYVSSRFSTNPPLNTALSPHSRYGKKPTFTRYETRDAEIRNVVGWSSVTFQEGERDPIPGLHHPESVAILCRTNHTLRLFLKEFVSRGMMPVLSKGSFWDSRRPAAMLTLLNLLVHKKDVYFESLIKSRPYKFPGLGLKFFETLQAYSSSLKLPYWDTLHVLANTAVNEAILNVPVDPLTKSTLLKLAKFSENLLKASKNLDAFVAGKMSITVDDLIGLPRSHNSDYGDDFTQTDRDTDYQSLFFEYLKGFSSVPDFLENVFDFQNPKSAQDGVHLLTIHASKGLEFDHVYVPSMVSGQFPLYHSEQPFRFDHFPSGYDSSVNEANHYLEETSCLYVALSRARHSLYLSAFDYHPKTSYKPRPLAWYPDPSTDFFRPAPNIQEPYVDVELLTNDLLRLSKPSDSEFPPAYFVRGL